MNEQKLNQIKFGIAGGITGVAAAILFEFFLVIKYLAFYNNLMINVYGVAGITILSIVKIMFFSMISSFIIGFCLTWLFSWIYNKLLKIRIR